MKMRYVTSLALAGGTLLAACGGSANVSSASPSSSSQAGSTTTAAPSTTTVSYGMVGLFGSALPQIVGIHEGFFAKSHLKVNLVVVGQSQPICQQLIGGALDFGNCSETDTIQAIEKGGPLTEIDNEYSTSLPYDLVVGKGITSWAQLKGKTVMLGGPRDNTVYYFSLMAKAAGLSLSDFNYTYAGASSARFAALESGAVAGTLLTIPFNLTAESKGLLKLSTSTGLLTPQNYAGGGTVVNTSYASSHPQVIKDYLTAYKESMQWLYDPANEAQALQLMEKYTHASAASAQDTYKYLVQAKYWEPTGTIVPSAIQGAEQSLYSLGFLKGTPPPAAKFYTNKYLGATS